MDVIEMKKGIFHYKSFYYIWAIMTAVYYHEQFTIQLNGIDENKSASN